MTQWLITAAQKYGSYKKTQRGIWGIVCTKLFSVHVVSIINSSYAILRFHVI